MGNPALVVVVVVGLSELVLEAGAYTIPVAVTVEVVNEAVKDVKEQCLQHYVACIASELYRRLGRGHGDTRCNLCRDVCVDDNGTWPLRVGNGTCKYWRRNETR
jgi:hypothetical protein